MEGATGGTWDRVIVAGSPFTIWGVESYPTWFREFGFGAAFSTGSGYVAFTCEPNTGFTRTGTITISSGVPTVTLTVIQAGSAYTYGTFAALTPPVATLASSGLISPAGVAVDAAGNVFFTDAGGGGMVYEWSPPSGPAKAPASPPPTAWVPSGVAVDASDDIYVADSAYGTIWAWLPGSPDGYFSPAVTSSSFGPTAFGATFNPVGVAAYAIQGIYIADSGNQTIWPWTTAEGIGTPLVALATSPAGAISLATLPSSYSAFNPVGVAVDAAGTVYIADSANQTIWEVIPDESYVGALIAGLTGLQGVAVDGAGNVYIVNSGTQPLMEWMPVLSTWSESGSSSGFSPLDSLFASAFPNPQGVAVDGAGDVYVAEGGTPAIEELPYAFVDPTPLRQPEPSSWGRDSLPPVVPTTVNLDLPGLAPAVESTPWLRISGTGEGVVSFAFTPNSTWSSRSGSFSVLGETVTVTQQGTPATTPSCYSPTTASPVYWWPGEGNTTDIKSQNNATGEGDEATIPPGVTYAPGIDGQGLAFSFDGGGYLSTSDQVSDPETFTLECWFMTAPGYDGGGVLIGFSSYQTGTQGGDQYDRIILMDSDGYLHFGVWFQGGLSAVDSLYWCNDGLWHHVAATLNAADGINLYVDGNLAMNNPDGVGAQPYTGWWRIGEDNLGNWPYEYSSQYFAGAIGEVSIYNAELNSGDIANIYAAGAAGKCIPSSSPPLTTPGQVVTVAVTPTSASGGISATLNSNSGDSDNDLPSVSVATYGSTPPASTPAFGSPAAVYFDLKVTFPTTPPSTPPSTLDWLTAVFDYPVTSLSEPEPGLYYYPVGGRPVAVQGDSAPEAGPPLVAPTETTLPGFFQYTVLLDQYSVPPIMDLNGTVFVLAQAPSTPAIYWTAPTPITYGTPLSGAQLDAYVTPSIAGTFTYDPPAGTVLEAGNGQTLSVTFRPTDTAVAPLTASVTINVEPALLTLTALDQRKTYGQKLNLGTRAFKAVGLVGRDTVTGVTLTSAGAAPAATVAGSPYPITITPGSAVGKGLGNYKIYYRPGRLTVKPAQLMITADNQTKPYGQKLNLGTTLFTTVGLVNGNTVTSVTLSRPGAITLAKPGMYPIIPGPPVVGTGLPNYNVSYVDGTLTVTGTVH